MAFGTLSKTAVALVASVAFLYQFLLRDFLLVSFGVGRQVQPLNDFPYQCRRVTGPGLEACEDMWLSPKRRTLYLACSESLSRRDWMPNIHRFNVSGLPSNDKIIAMKIDQPKGAGFAYESLQMPSEYSSVQNDNRLYLVGMTGVVREDHDELYIVNARPAADPLTGRYLDQEAVGGNSTIEHLTVDARGKVSHVKTWAKHEITTPNNIAPLDDGSFYFTNDHGPHKSGIWHKLSDLVRLGDVSYCSKAGECKRVSAGHAFPNGLALGKDGLLYVPSAALGSIQIFKPAVDRSIVKVGDVNVPMPLDNISPDANGDLYIAGIPKAFAMMGGFDDPLNARPPATVWRVHKRDDGTYDVSKVLEDRDAEALPGATTAVHDAKTGRLFVSGIYSPFVTVCEKKEIDGSDSVTRGREEL